MRDDGWLRTGWPEECEAITNGKMKRLLCFKTSIFHFTIYLRTYTKETA
jgi:hypothetical protein